MPAALQVHDLLEEAAVRKFCVKLVQSLRPCCQCIHLCTEAVPQRGGAEASLLLVLVVQLGLFLPLQQALKVPDKLHTMVGRECLYYLDTSAPSSSTSRHRTPAAIQLQPAVWGEGSDTTHLKGMAAAGLVGCQLSTSLWRCHSWVQGLEDVRAPLPVAQRQELRGLGFCVATHAWLATSSNDPSRGMDDASVQVVVFVCSASQLCLALALTLDP
eukprot:CAMPEP_0115373380 /NCGR_PEP_ID=MMETSP0271-20121206/1403_1 /TAXON_ID=71861 /ORGANISM="Scrippsiella trochoidea, Strain CCMP3099" /LENGTH=214 /DNA_ID=CAMNT_0002796383 /DNA_START=46 /DNA_END=691 /DNA_ORIENTATION=+